jgi:hypothetical protein
VREGNRGGVVRRQVLVKPGFDLIHENLQFLIDIPKFSTTADKSHQPVNRNK